MSNGDDRAFGRLEAEVENLQREVGGLRKDVKQIQTTLSEARGGWKTLVLVAGIAGTMGAAATKIASIFHLIK